MTASLLWEILIAVGTVLVAPFVSWVLVGRKKLRIDQFTAYTTAQNTRIEQQDRVIIDQGNRIDGLEQKILDREEALDAERDAHAATRDRLAAAVSQLATMKDTVRRYFQQVSDAWGTTGRGIMPRPDPTDLEWLAKPLQQVDDIPHLPGVP